MRKRLIQAKIFNREGNQLDQLIDISDKIEPYITLNNNKYHYSYSHGCYIQDDDEYDDEDDIPF